MIVIFACFFQSWVCFQNPVGFWPPKGFSILILDSLAVGGMMCTTSGQVNAIWSMICVTKRPCDSADWCQVGDPTSSRISRSQGLYKKNRVARKPGQVCREPQGPGPIVFPFHDMGRSLQCFGGTSIFYIPYDLEELQVMYVYTSILGYGGT